LFFLLTAQPGIFITKISESFSGFYEGIFAHRYRVISTVHFDFDLVDLKIHSSGLRRVEIKSSGLTSVKIRIVFYCSFRLIICKRAVSSPK